MSPRRQRRDRLGELGVEPPSLPRVAIPTGFKVWMAVIALTGLLTTGGLVWLIVWIVLRFTS
jgi:hypothetical protein